jgi:hypothetical protein
MIFETFVTKQLLTTNKPIKPLLHLKLPQHYFSKFVDSRVLNGVVRFHSIDRLDVVFNFRPLILLPFTCSSGNQYFAAVFPLSQTGSRFRCAVATWHISLIADGDSSFHIILLFCIIATDFQLRHMCLTGITAPSDHNIETN